MPLPSRLKPKRNPEISEEFPTPIEPIPSPENAPASWDSESIPVPMSAPMPAPEPSHTASFAIPPMPVRSSAVPAPAAAAPVCPAPVPNAAAPVRPAPVSSPFADSPNASIPDRLDAIDRRLFELNDQLSEVGIAALNCQEKLNDPELLYTKIDLIHNDIKTIRDGLSQPPADTELLSQLQAMTDRQEKTERMLTQALRENATFQQQVRQGMQHDLDELRQQLSGAPFNPILKEIANMYCEYQLLLEDTEISDKSRRNLTALFGQMEDLLADYDAEVVISKVGEERPKRQCRIINQVPTGDQAMHNTIAKSRRPGVIRDRQVLYHEFVDVFVYDPALDPGADGSQPPVVPVEAPADPEQLG